jgi:hypothetical protein
MNEIQSELGDILAECKGIAVELDALRKESGGDHADIINGLTQVVEGNIAILRKAVGE